MNTVFLICGVSGSGKTWVCKQLQDKFCYVPHDEHYDDIVETLKELKTRVTHPFLTECPFGERLIRSELMGNGFLVKPYFVIEEPSLIQKRYLEREKKPLPKAALTRASTILDRALEWSAPYGTSNQILQMLRTVAL